MKFLIVLSLVAIALSDDSAETLLRESSDVFTSRMFSQVAKNNPGQSVVLSAFSALSPLAQLTLASVGESHDELLRTIGFPNDNVTKVVFAHANRKLRDVEGVDLRIANRIYIESGATLNEEFAALSRDIFDSDVKNVDFVKNVETAKEINTWVEDNTNKRIKDLVDPNTLSVDTVSVLVNAIYFKGTWKSTFNEGLTSDRDFYVSKDKTVKVPMMYNTDEFNYGESKELDAKLLELPYIGEETSLLIVLPNEVDGINGLLEKLKDSSVLPKAIKKLSSSEVQVSLPKFKIETTINLKDVLTKMGVTKLFTVGQARLENMVNGEKDMFVSVAVQKAFIEVNEKGSEAAAATHFITVTLSETSFTAPKFFNADRPFYYLLKQNGLTLFNGVFYY